MLASLPREVLQHLLLHVEDAQDKTSLGCTCTQLRDAVFSDDVVAWQSCSLRSRHLVTDTLTCFACAARLCALGVRTLRIQCLTYECPMRVLSVLEEHEGGTYALERLIFADGGANYQLNSCALDGSGVPQLASVRELHRLFDEARRKNMPRLEKIVYELVYSLPTFTDFFTMDFPVKVEFRRIAYISTINADPQIFVNSLKHVGCEDVNFTVDTDVSLRAIQLLCEENRIKKLRMFINTVIEWTEPVLLSMKSNTSIQLINFKLFTVSSTRLFDFIRLVSHLPSRVEVLNFSHQASADVIVKSVAPASVFVELAKYPRLWYVGIFNFPFSKEVTGFENHLACTTRIEELDIQHWASWLTPEFMDFFVRVCPHLQTVTLKGVSNFHALADTIEGTARRRDIDFVLDVSAKNLTREMNRKFLATKNIYYNSS